MLQRRGAPARSARTPRPRPVRRRWSDAEAGWGLSCRTPSHVPADSADLREWAALHPQTPGSGETREAAADRSGVFQAARRGLHRGRVRIPTDSVRRASGQCAAPIRHCRKCARSVSGPGCAFRWPVWPVSDHKAHRSGAWWHVAGRTAWTSPAVQRECPRTSECRAPCASAREQPARRRQPMPSGQGSCNGWSTPVRRQRWLCHPPFRRPIRRYTG